MSKQITVTLSDYVYRQAEAVAQATNRPVADVLGETIRQAFPPLHVDANRARMQQEVAAFETNHAALWRQYAHQFVALKEGAVIDHDKDELALVARIEANHPDDVILIRQVLSQPPPSLRFRSPRFVDPS